ncbi:unnamed protein product [Moneuplotes crassus]|uniref:Poly(3-hydroxybutyrate) depolymerase n=1 Tax=Euplotes crassus TaxID=5936 RepID=A0AAD1XIU1_EUPCR|nr:unnamed protein product [Moneuplotes crassus]
MIKSTLFHLFLLSFIGSVLSNNSTESDNLINIKTSKDTSISGFSSGGAMTGQMLVAYSSEIKGAGIFSSPPYFCTKGAAISLLDCTTTGVSLYSDQIVLAAKGFEQLGQIDKLSNFKNKKIYMYSGKRDSVVWNGVVKKNQEFFHKLGADITTEYTLSAEHAFPTDFYGNTCGILGKPFINNCNYDGPKEALEYVFGKKLLPNELYKDENIKSFSQRKYQIGYKHSLADTGYIYIPDACYEKQCELHIVFHGCLQTIDDIGLDYIYGTGYLGLAEANDLVILFPQIKKSSLIGNPQGCWDWWGYSETIPKPLQWTFPTKYGVQIQAIHNMMLDLQDGTFGVDSFPISPDFLKSSY